MNEDINRHIPEADQLIESWSAMPKDKLPKGTQGLFEDNTDFLQGITDPWRKACVARLLENSRKLYEATSTDNVGTFPKFIFPLIRSVYMNIPTGDLFSMQPMSGPTGLVWYVDFIYGNTKGSVAAGSKAYDAQTGPQNGQSKYATEEISGETLGTGDDSEDQFTGNLSYITVRAASLQITDGTQTVTDNGAGTFTGDGTGTIYYDTGAYDVTFTNPPADGSVIAADYEYNSESSDMTGNKIPQVDIQLRSSSITAQPVRLRTVWTTDAEQDLYNQFGIVAQTELMGFTGNEIQKEIYNALIGQARTVAPGGYIEWDSTVPLAVAEVLHRQALPTRFTAASNAIFTRTQRWGANWVVIGPNLASYVEALPTEFLSRLVRLMVLVFIRLVR